MSHILIIYLVFALFVSVLNIFLTLVLYRKKQLRILFYYLFFIAIQLYDNLTSAVLSYLTLNVYKKALPPSLFVFQEINDLIPLLLYFIVGALILNAFLGRNIILEKQRGYLVLFCVSVILITIAEPEFLAKIQSVKLSIYLVLLYSMIIFLRRIQQIESFQYISVLKRVALISLVIFPFVILENIRVLLPLFTPDPGNFFGPTSFLILNSYGLYYASLYLFSSEEQLKERKLKDIVRIYKITDRESEVLLLVLEGASNKEISEKLFISEGTVKNYIYSIFKKVNVKSRIQLISFLKA